MRYTYSASSIDYSKVDKVIHSFVYPDASGNIVAPADFIYPDLITQCTSHGVKVWVGVRGSDDGVFASMASTSATRLAFIQNIYAFCQSQGYSGIVLDWEYPNNSTQQANFASLVQEMRAYLDQSNAPIILASTFNANPWNLSPSAVFPYLDKVLIMTYDFHGPWYPHTGYNSPLYGEPDISHPARSLSDSVQKFITQYGVPKDRLYAGVAFYGWDFSSSGLYQIHTGAVPKNYKNIAPLIGGQWIRYFDSTCQVPYLVSPGHILSYDDEESIALKGAYIRGQDLQGTMIWALGLDYSGTNAPLLSALRASTDAIDYSATSFSVITGTKSGGWLGSLHDDDNAALEIQSAAQSGTHQLEYNIYATINEPRTNVSSIKVRFKARYSVSGVKQKIYLYNYITSQYVELSNFTLGGEKTQTTLAVGPEYMNTNGQVSLKIYARNPSQAFTQATDYVNIEIIGT